MPDLGIPPSRGTEQGPAWIPLWKLSLDNPSPSPLRSPWLLWPLWLLTVHVSLWKLWIVKCPHISNSLSDSAFLLSWMPTEDFWLQSFQDKNCSSCSSMDKAVQYPSWAGERMLFPTLSELLLSFSSFFNYALKSLFLLILSFWWIIFPHKRKQVEMITTWHETRK